MRLRWLCYPLLLFTAYLDGNEKSHALSLEIAQLAFGRSSISYQQQIDWKASISISGNTYLSFTDLPRILSQHLKDILPQTQQLLLATSYDLHFGLGLGWNYWWQHILKGSFIGAGVQGSYQIYDLSIDGQSYQGNALITGVNFQAGHRWLFDWWSITLNAEVGLLVPFELSAPLPTALRQARPYGAVGASIALHW